MARQIGDLPHALDEGKALRDAVAKAADKKAASKARTVGFIIAVYAQGEVARGGPKAQAKSGTC